MDVSDVEALHWSGSGTSSRGDAMRSDTVSLNREGCSTSYASSTERSENELNSVIADQSDISNASLENIAEATPNDLETLGSSIDDGGNSSNRGDASVQSNIDLVVSSDHV